MYNTTYLGRPRERTLKDASALSYLLGRIVMWYVSPRRLRPARSIHDPALAFLPRPLSASCREGAQPLMRPTKGFSAESCRPLAWSSPSAGHCLLSTPAPSKRLMQGGGPTTHAAYHGVAMTETDVSCALGPPSPDGTRPEHSARSKARVTLRGSRYPSL